MRKVARHAGDRSECQLLGIKHVQPQEESEDMYLLLIQAEHIANLDVGNNFSGLAS